MAGSRFSLSSWEGGGGEELQTDMGEADFIQVTFTQSYTSALYIGCPIRYSLPSNFHCIWLDRTYLTTVPVYTTRTLLG